MNEGQEIRSLENLNETLIAKVSFLENKVENLNLKFQKQETVLKQKDEALNKAEKIIRKLQTDTQNAKRNIEMSEQQMKTLKEQYRNLSATFDKQEKFIQHKEYEKGPSETIKFELREMQAKIDGLRREKILAVDIEKDKYQNMLHKYTDLQRDFEELSLAFEAKDQESMTLHSHNNIQNTQIMSLQEEISSMIDKLEDVRKTYELELESKDDQLQNNRNQALAQIRQMQQTMRQDSVNNQKEIMKLKEELKINISKREKHNISLTDEKRKKLDNILAQRRPKSPKNQRISQDTTNSYSFSGRSNSVSAHHLSSFSSETRQSQLLNSPLISWLKQELQASWLREKSLKSYVQQYADRCLSKMQMRLEDLMSQEARIRSEVEMWQMRNEEMETRLLRSNQKLWSMKQICFEQQKLLKRQTVEKQAQNTELRAYRTIAEENILLCKSHYYDIYDQLKSVDHYNSIYQNMSVARDSMIENDQDRAKMVEKMDQQVLQVKQNRQRIEDQQEQIRFLESENQQLMVNSDNQVDHFKCKLQNIFDVLDPETSRALIDPSIEQLENLIVNKMQKFEVSVNEIGNEKENEIIFDLEQTIKSLHEKVLILENENSILSQNMQKYEKNFALDSKLQNEYGLLQIENRQLRCDISEKQIIIEEQSQKVNRLQKENKETRDRLFTHESLFGQNTFDKGNVSQNALRQPTGLAPRQNIPQPCSYPTLMANMSMSQNNIIDMNLSQDYQAQAPHIVDQQVEQHRNQMVVIQSLKEDIIDAVNDLKGKKDIWNLSSSQEQKCDVIIKKMVFNAREVDHIGHTYDLVRSLFDIIREVQKTGQSKIEKKEEKINEIQGCKSDNENKILKNLEIVIDVFKKAGQKIGKIGERDWREVVEQQTYVLEEVIHIQENMEKGQKQLKNAQENFSHALSDFQFCLNKALDNVVSKDSDMPKSNRSFISESDFKKEIVSIFTSNKEEAFEIISKYGKPQTILEIKQLLNKVLKSLREELAVTNSIAVKRINADLIEYESSQRQNIEKMRSMSHDQLIKTIGDLKSEILSLRINEIYMKKSAEQLKALKNAMKVANFQAFETNEDAKLLRCLEEISDSIQKEIKNSFQLDSKGGSMVRNEFNMQLQAIFEDKIRKIRENNKISLNLKIFK